MSAPRYLDPPHQGSLIVHAILGHARGSPKCLDGAQMGREFSNLRIQLADQRVELFSSWLCEWVLVIGHVHLPASGGGTLEVSEQKQANTISIGRDANIRCEMNHAPRFTRLFACLTERLQFVEALAWRNDSEDRAPKSWARKWP